MLLGSELFLAVMLHCSQTDLGARCSAHPRQQVCVVDGAVRAVGVADRSGDVSLHLRSAQGTGPARARPLLQRGRAAIPPAVPAADHALSSLHCMASSECGEAASGVVWRVLKEDVVLGVGTKMRHSCEESRPGARRV